MSLRIHVNICPAVVKCVSIHELCQVVSAEILMASETGCPIEMHKIPIKQCDQMYDSDCRGDQFMPFHRYRRSQEHFSSRKTSFPQF